MKRYTLYIDTTGHNKTKVEIKGLNKEASKTIKSKAQVVLVLIIELLNQHNISLKDLKEIEVNTSPGSFVGVRIGMTVANTLGYVFSIPVNKKKCVTLASY